MHERTFLRYLLNLSSRLGVVPRWDAVLLLLVSTSGCALLPEKTPLDYRTVEASPHRDTAKAEQEHEKALQALDRCQEKGICPIDCGCILGKRCGFHEAEERLQNALIADVRYGPAHNTLGLLYYRQQKLYLAAWEFDYAMRLMKGRPEPVNNMGLVYEASGQNPKAAEMYEQALALAPENPEYIGNLARARLKQGEPTVAVRHLLERTVIVDSRPEWVAWARDQLGTHPDHSLIIREPFEELAPSPPIETQGPLEELPAGDPGPVLPISEHANDPGAVAP